MRCTQFIGLNERALCLLECNKRLCYMDHITRVFPDGKEKRLPGRGVYNTPSENTSKRWFGMDDDSGFLRRYTMLDGSKVTEYVQIEPCSADPCIFLALQDENGYPIPETLWSYEEIENF